LIFSVASLILVSCLSWFLNTNNAIHQENISHYIIITFIVALAVFFGIRRIKSLKRGQPPEDELSKQIMLRASSLAYYISLYLWLFVMYISDKVKWEAHTLIGTGILGMAIIFAASWLYVSFFGFRNE
jgi:positive regulator of sigma E activity